MGYEQTGILITLIKSEMEPHILREVEVAMKKKTIQII